ncbi:hypothetical protein CYMTET_20305 [Cymbomonas tetramitiformis]|uniref:Uncharacterized protein n=1 Tax=Cymbomonas tetramitiformis TaxID=36881 RepID=A0AAE0L411_9CHLO|nr:hypothetical protein CYMTET_20305 [Cymbomonas tetramitiformis]
MGKEAPGTRSGSGVCIPSAAPEAQEDIRVACARTPCRRAMEALYAVSEVRDYGVRWLERSKKVSQATSKTRSLKPYMALDVEWVSSEAA